MPPGWHTGEGDKAGGCRAEFKCTFINNRYGHSAKYLPVTTTILSH